MTTDNIPHTHTHDYIVEDESNKIFAFSEKNKIKSFSFFLPLLPKVRQPYILYTIRAYLLTTSFGFFYFFWSVGGGERITFI